MWKKTVDNARGQSRRGNAILQFLRAISYPPPAAARQLGDTSTFLSALLYGLVDQRLDCSRSVLELKRPHKAHSPHFNKELCKDLVGKTARHKRDTVKINHDFLPIEHGQEIPQLIADWRASQTVPRRFALITHNKVTAALRALVLEFYEVDWVMDFPVELQGLGKNAGARTINTGNNKCTLVWYDLVAYRKAFARPRIVSQMGVAGMDLEIATANSTNLKAAKQTVALPQRLVSCHAFTNGALYGVRI